MCARFLANFGEKENEKRKKGGKETERQKRKTKNKGRQVCPLFLFVCLRESSHSKKREFCLSRRRRRRSKKKETKFSFSSRKTNIPPFFFFCTTEKPPTREDRPFKSGASFLPSLPSALKEERWHWVGEKANTAAPNNNANNKLAENNGGGGGNAATIANASKALRKRAFGEVEDLENYYRVTNTRLRDDERERERTGKTRKHVHLLFHANSWRV